MPEPRVLITGATGFVGRRLVDQALRAGWEVIALVPSSERDSQLARAMERTRTGGPRVHLIEGGLDQIGAWQAQAAALAPQACVHLAWNTTPGIYLHGHENLAWLNWTNQLFARLPDWGVKHIVGVGTCAEYDADHGYLRETTPTRALTLYAASKLASRGIGEQLAVRSGVRFSWARIFHLYGPGEHPARLIAACIQAMLAGERFEATEGRQVRDFLHVDDVAAGLLCVLGSERRDDVPADVNVCSGEPVTVRDVLQTVARVIGRPDLLALGARPSANWDPPFLCGDNTRLRSYGWRPNFALVDGLTDAVGWWRQRR